MEADKIEQLSVFYRYGTMFEQASVDIFCSRLRNFTLPTYIETSPLKSPCKNCPDRCMYVSANPFSTISNVTGPRKTTFIAHTIKF